MQFFSFLWYPIIRIEWYFMKKIILFFFLITFIYTNDVFAANPKMVEGESIVLDGVTTCVSSDGFYNAFFIEENKCLVTSLYSGSTVSKCIEGNCFDLENGNLDTVENKITLEQIVKTWNDKDGLTRNLYIYLYEHPFWGEPPDDLLLEAGSTDDSIYFNYVNDYLVGLFKYEYNDETNTLTYNQSGTMGGENTAYYSMPYDMIYYIYEEASPNYLEAEEIRSDAEKIKYVDLSSVPYEKSLTYGDADSYELKVSLLLDGEINNRVISSYLANVPRAPVIPADPIEPEETPQATVKNPETGKYLAVFGIVMLVFVGVVILIKNKAVIKKI